MFQRSYVVHGGLVFASILFCLIALETGFRLYAYQTQTESIIALQHERPLPAPDHACSLGEIIQIRDSNVIPYELRPGLHTRFLDVPLRTNTFGFRSPEISKQKNGAIRILGIGDSVMFGWGVPAQRSYLAVARKILARKFSGCRFESINTAVPGYNGVIEAATLRERGLAFYPDVVVLGVVQNDLDLPNFIYAREDYFSLKQSFLKKFLSDRLARVALVDAPRREGGDGFIRDVRAVPSQFRHLVGRKNYLRAVREIQGLTERRGVPLITLSHGALNMQLEKIFNNLAIPVLEMGAPWQSYARKQGIDPTAASMLEPGVDPHPSALLHAVIGEELATAIAEQIKGRFSCLDETRHRAG